ncbi:hypothetical protein HMPREF0294_1234 [Corynebacterium glucuronolyticum ATCC 51867]|uniref:Uncharacterized protein n=1 Tax=Corynebacterium glucuronolyticum ATCC 51866 TaxID=548478 RepID=A0ABM9XRC2_9CORY|nr:hypothetical protein HMPREF0294_1234 [Corynebacterium glucuronolyticum ATCC 51867]EEI63732.1 hypothetical protein HMPREF0293_0797 [Corynebacterium glucuronolyticum ATCC 51866]
MWFPQGGVHLHLGKKTAVGTSIAGAPGVLSAPATREKEKDMLVGTAR